MQVRGTSPALPLQGLVARLPHSQLPIDLSIISVFDQHLIPPQSDLVSARLHDTPDVSAYDAFHVCNKSTVQTTDDGDSVSLTKPTVWQAMKLAGLTHGLPELPRS